jgi:hypothetical protein
MLNLKIIFEILITSFIESKNFAIAFYIGIAKEKTQVRIENFKYAEWKS